VNTGVADTTYYLGDPEESFQPLFDSTVPGCPVRYEITATGDATDTNFLTSFSTSTGTVTV